MPELPEVETTLRGLFPYLMGQTIETVMLRHSQLRWPIAQDLPDILFQQRIHGLSRRAKYLLMHMDKGVLILHLGMSGSLKILSHWTEPLKHDHVDWILENQRVLRYTDPRRFGAILWTQDDPLSHPLLKHLGPEPLSNDFSAEYLYDKAQGRCVPIKVFLMNAHAVVGVGNIYAQEALFLAKIHPKTPAGALSWALCETLVETIKGVLSAAIAEGGTTLRDFYHSEGRPGYFAQKLCVYGRQGLPCVACNTLLKEVRQAQRSTVFCPHCQVHNED